jgi:hypothetical protein
MSDSEFSATTGVNFAVSSQHDEEANHVPADTSLWHQQDQEHRQPLSECDTNLSITELDDNAGSTAQQLLTVVASSSGLINQLVQQFAALNELVRSDLSAFDCQRQGNEETELDELRRQVAGLTQELTDVRQQNDDLALKLADADVRDANSVGDTAKTGELSWEARREMILAQMEDDSFDAEAFVSALQTESEKTTCDPIAHVQQLHIELQRRGDEIQQLQSQLRKQQEGCAEAVAGEAPSLIETDDVVREERERLRQLRSEWEEKFREGEIAASLERAKLSRERRQLMLRNQEIEEQLSHLRRQVEEDRKAGVAGARRWLAKLGLDDKS